MRITILLVLAAACIWAQPSSTTPTISVGPNAPSPTACGPLAVGSIYVRSESAANGPINVSRCTQVGDLTFAWQPIGHYAGAALPAKCATGDIAFDTDATAGQNVYGCTATDTWTLQDGGGVTPGGTDGQVQYNNAGAFGGITLPSSGILKGGAGPIFEQAVAGTDYSPATSGSALLRANGAGGTTSATSTNVISLFGGGSCSGYLKSDGSCDNPTGSGDVVGPASATDNAVVRYNLTTGKLVQNSGVTIDDSDNISTAGVISVGVGGSTAGGLVLKQGTATSPAANTVLIQAPASVTAYNIVVPGAAGTGFLSCVDSSGTVTCSFAPIPSTTKWSVSVAGCNQTAAGPALNLPVTSPADPQCKGGTARFGALDFVDSGTTYGLLSYLTPADITGTLDFRVLWYASDTSTSHKITIERACKAANTDMTSDPSYTSVGTITANSSSTTNGMVLSSLTGVTPCSASEWAVFRIGRDVSDTSTVTQSVVEFEQTMTRQ